MNSVICPKCGSMKVAESREIVEKDTKKSLLKSKSMPIYCCEYCGAKFSLIKVI